MKLLPTARKRKANGAVLYRGPSMLDGAPIAVIMTGLRRKSANIKTGDMLQIWIIRSDVSPLAALDTGADESICGDCKHRGAACYVRVEHAPLQIFKSFVAGAYEDWTAAMPVDAISGRKVRFGAYGDPSAVPYKVWRRVLDKRVANWTGYTHQWRNPAFQRLRNVMMASVDSREEMEHATRLGWRTFRVRDTHEALSEGSEIACPASDEGGKRVTCENCGLCKGQRSGARNIAIIVHGTGAKAFREGR